ncbi:MAG: LPS assembly protein LptD [Rhodobacteraceae bacterium]|nr:LPS assembly protein LptD [Paracoccaceae bacterium]
MTRQFPLAVRSGLLALLLAIALPFVGLAQSDDTTVAPAILVADRVFLTKDSKLIAEGNVEAFSGDIRLQASRITFDRASGELSIEGPIRIDQGGASTILASAAELDAELQNGILTGARLVLDQQLQLASVLMTRVGGRYTRLDKTAVTSCHICENGKPPLWQIRANRVIHDQLEQQLYFEEAQLQVLDVPVFYWPYLRLPDPTLKRSNGFLIPSIRTTNQLGTGVRVPYFFQLGDHADLTLAPYLSPNTRTLDFRYRQAFKRGSYIFEGAYTRDDLIPGKDRGYLFGEGLFSLQNDFELSFDIQAVSDNAYLVDYGLPDSDRLQSEVALTRVNRDSAFQANLIHFKSLRDSDDNATQPNLVADARYQHRFHPTSVGGEIRLGLDIHGHYRSSSVPTDGRDVERTTVELNWLRNWILPYGVRADFTAGVALDHFNISHDPLYPEPVTRTTPSTSLKFSYPMTRVAASGATHFLEPVMQIGWADVNGGDVPDDESRFVEFDQGNLLSMSRFPAYDRREQGATFVYGLNWTRVAPSGWQAFASAGQVFRSLDDPAFTTSSGLSGTTSDFVLGGQLKLDKGLSLTAHTLLDNNFSLSKAELRGDWTGKRMQISGTYLWLEPDAREGRDSRVSEVWFDGDYAITPFWTANANVRYDIADTRATTAGLGLVYQNECIEFDLSVKRRYTSSTSVEPTTDFRFGIALRGFSVASGTEKYRRSCS